MLLEMDFKSLKLVEWFLDNIGWDCIITWSDTDCLLFIYHVSWQVCGLDGVMENWRIHIEYEYKCIHIMEDIV